MNLGFSFKAVFVKIKFSSKLSKAKIPLLFLKAAFSFHEVLVQGSCQAPGAEGPALSMGQSQSYKTVMLCIYPAQQGSVCGIKLWPR